jgi:hypothetical protein
MELEGSQGAELMMVVAVAAAVMAPLAKEGV